MLLCGRVGPQMTAGLSATCASSPACASNFSFLRWLRAFGGPGNVRALDDLNVQITLRATLRALYEATDHAFRIDLLPCSCSTANPADMDRNESIVSHMAPRSDRVSGAIRHPASSMKFQDFR